MASMMQYVDVARTHEILSRYRPIAPKPPVEKAPGVANVRVPARTPRARKRGRGSCGSASQKRSRTCVPLLPLPVHAEAQLGLAVQRFARGFSVFPVPCQKGDRGCDGGDLSLSLLPPVSEAREKGSGGGLDLNTTPVDRDLVGNLQKTSCVIVPQPVRPIGSTITVSEVSERAGIVPVARKREEVEEEAEGDELPAVISDAHNRVRLANSAYKEMVGQPECLWLRSMVAAGVGSKVAPRIGGEVMLHFTESPVPVSANGFSCMVKIEWACNGQKKHLSAPCDVVRVSCESKDYLYAWRFHITKPMPM